MSNVHRCDLPSHPIEGQSRCGCPYYRCECGFTRPIHTLACAQKSLLAQTSPVRWVESVGTGTNPAPVPSPATSTTTEESR